MIILNLDNPACIEINNHAICGSGEVITDAIVKATIFDSSGNEVSGQTWPLVMTHYNAGRYRGVTGVLNLIENDIYTVTVVSETAGGTRLAKWNADVTATRRLIQ